MSNKFSEWFDKATTAQRKALATFCRSSVASLRQVARAYRSETKEPDISADFAARIEVGIRQTDILASVTRADLCSTCRKCPYYQDSLINKQH